MSTDMKLPELGENIEGGDVLRVMVKPGDAIKKDQPVLELETDKATIEVPSSADGVVKEVKVKPGEKVKVGADDLHRRRRAAAGRSAPAKSEKASREARSRQPERTAERSRARRSGVEPKPSKPPKRGEAQSRSRRDEAVEAGCARRHAAAGAAGEGGRGCRAVVHSGRAFGAPAGARARRKYSGHSRLRSGRTHLDGRCHRVCAAAAVRRGCGALAGVGCATRCPTSANGERSSARR